MYVIGTAGHVDHVKSKLVEALTGIDPDRLEEEKRRGLTIDLGFAWLTLPSGREVGIVDVPGHERFIRNMLAGATGTSVCLFVVAANEGWMPQSAEHLSTIDLLGIDSAVVVLTKLDTVDEPTLEEVRAGVRTRLRASLLAGAEIVACSSVTEAGIDDVVGALERLLDATTALHDDDRARLWVDRAFSITGSGTIVTGTLMGGTLSVGDEGHGPRRSLGWNLGARARSSITQEGCGATRPGASDRDQPCRDRSPEGRARERRRVSGQVGRYRAHQRGGARPRRIDDGTQLQPHCEG